MTKKSQDCEILTNNIIKVYLPCCTPSLAHRSRQLRITPVVHPLIGEILNLNGKLVPMGKEVCTEYIAHGSPSSPSTGFPPRLPQSHSSISNQSKPKINKSMQLFRTIISDSWEKKARVITEVKKSIFPPFKLKISRKMSDKAQTRPNSWK